MEKITSILAKKQPHFHTVSPATSLEDALNQMCCENVDHLVVIDDDERFLGVISEHEVATKAIVSGKSLSKTEVKDMMNTKLPFATTNDSVEKCMQMMRRFNVRWVPVFENFTFKGVVSSEDILDEAVYNRSGIFDEEVTTPSRWA